MEFWRRVLTLFLSYVLVVIKRLRAINEKTAQSLLFVIAVKRRYSVNSIIRKFLSKLKSVKPNKPIITIIVKIKKTHEKKFASLSLALENIPQSLVDLLLDKAALGNGRLELYLKHPGKPTDNPDLYPDNNDNPDGTKNSCRGFLFYFYIYINIFQVTTKEYSF